MTILVLADTRFPIERANGLQTMATCDALARRGHDVELVVRPDAASPPRDPFAFYGLSPAPRLRIRVVAGAGRGGPRRRRMRFLLAALAAATERRGPVVFTRDVSLAAFLLQLPSFRRPRVVFEAHGVAAVVAEDMPRLLGRPEAAASARKLARLDRQERRVWRSAAACVALTEALAADLADRHGPRDRVHVVGDAARRPDPPPPAPPREPFTVGYAGHLYPWKGVDVLVDALALVPEARGLIVGGHPGEADLDRIRRRITHAGLDGRITITGLMKPADVSGALAPAHVLVLPNTPTRMSERYTSPLKLFEYLWMGRPIVASDLPAIREVVTPDVSAIVSPAGDAHALAAAIRRVRADPALAERLGTAARALAPSYSWDARAERLEAALAEAAA